MNSAKKYEVWFLGTFYTFTIDTTNMDHDNLYRSFVQAIRNHRANPIEYRSKDAWAFLGKAFAEGIVEKS